MLLLAIDTATPQIGVALGSADGIVGQVRLVQGRRHAEALAPAVGYLLREAGCGPSDLAAIAVGVGPGLFTGLRVGVTTATVMAQALRVPVVPVPSLDLVAYPLRFTPRSLVAVTDARRGEVYYAVYRPVPGGIQRTTEYRVAPPEKLAAELEASGDGVLLAGDGASLYRDLLARVERVEFASAAYHYPSPTALVELGCARYRREEFARPLDVRPIYLRKSDAEINWDSKVFS